MPFFYNLAQFTLKFARFLVGVCSVSKGSEKGFPHIFLSPSKLQTFQSSHLFL